MGEVQRKLAVANCTLCETVENRDARIMELENMLSQKQSEVQSDWTYNLKWGSNIVIYHSSLHDSSNIQ